MLLSAPAQGKDSSPIHGSSTRRGRHRCGHDGQRKCVAHMPTAAATTEDSRSKFGRKLPTRLHDEAKMMIWLQNAALRPIASSGHKLAFEEAIPSMLLPLVTITKFDVILMLRETGRGLMGCGVYKPHLFRATIIHRLLPHFRTVLELMLKEAARPSSECR